VKWTDVDGVAILAEHKGVPVKATIEHLRDGSSYRWDVVGCAWGRLDLGEDLALLSAWKQGSPWFLFASALGRHAITYFPRLGSSVPLL